MSSPSEAGSEHPTEGARDVLPLRVGLTGSIGAGKSTVAKLLERHGAAVIDADRLAREATEDPRVLADIAAALGDDLVVTGAGGPELDRRRTAAKVFDDPEALRSLEAIVHPWVRLRAEQLFQALARRDDPPPVVVHDVPLLFESGLERGYDAVVVVDAPFEVRRERLRRRSGLSAAEVERREAAQMPAHEKVARADHVVVNSGDLGYLGSQVSRLWDALTNSRTSSPPT